MTLGENCPSGFDPDARITTPRLNDLSDPEIALDWILQVLNQPSYVIDALLVTDEVDKEWDAIKREHLQKYRVRSYPDPNTYLSGPDQEREDAIAIQDKLEAQLRQSANKDPRIRAKNRFLAMIADQTDGATAVRRLLEESVELDEADTDTALEELDGEATEAIGAFMGSHVINLLVSMRRYAEAVGNNSAIYQQQFMGLWDIYSAAQAQAAQSSED